MNYEIPINVQIGHKFFSAHAVVELLACRYFNSDKALDELISMDQNLIGWIQNTELFRDKKCYLPNEGMGFTNVRPSFFTLAEDCDGNIAEINKRLSQEKFPMAHLPHSASGKDSKSKFGSRSGGVIHAATFPILRDHEDRVMKQISERAEKNRQGLFEVEPLKLFNLRPNIEIVSESKLISNR
jgi:hypothetical protein